MVSNQNLTVLLTFAVVAIPSILVNLRVVYIVFVTSNRRSRPANILVAHLSSVVIVVTLVIYIYLLEKTNMVSLTGPGICNVFAFLRNNMYNVYPINAGAIIWVRTTITNANILRKSFVYRLIGAMWTITIFANLPSTFMVEFVKDLDNKKDKCKEIPLLGSSGATITYESLRFLFFNVLVGLYLIHATIKIRSSIKYFQLLKLVQNERMIKRIKQVRSIYLHTFVFLLIWLPNGIFLLLYKISNRLDWTTDYVKYLAPFVFLNYSAFVLCPLSYVFLLEDTSIAQFFAPYFPRKANTDLTISIEKNGLEHGDPGQIGGKVEPTTKQMKANVSNKAEDIDRIEAIEMSTMTTVELTGASSSLAFFATKNVKATQQLSKMQGSSIPAALLPTSFAKLQSVSVEIHVEPGIQLREENEDDNQV